MDYPRQTVLYSFRRCPYAMRARLAIYAAQLQVELREVVLKDKPADLLSLSPKGTVPVLQLADKVLEESLDIMQWALASNDPHHWYQSLSATQLEQSWTLIQHNDTEFKADLDRYKYADRYPEKTELEYREQGEKFLLLLEQQLQQHPAGLICNRLTFADIAILPFIRQFALVDWDWFDASPYPMLRQWLSEFMASAMFASVMQKYPQWHAGDAPVLFPAD
jgi:glutathione S-transferase